MSDLSDRIKLAEAIFQTVEDGMADVWVVHDGETYPRRFDPFTDANDDYAVLEWMRTRRDSLLAKDADAWHKFMAAIHETAFCTSLYKIGDYARVALKVLAEVSDG